ncbi:PRC-barrel domain-containing protein [Stappia sp.]|uniref:PRC-barrel domain-containing protein n=1 Tax=Stappia sp. TaxID=1870903 RepID=UPI003A98CF02
MISKLLATTATLAVLSMGPAWAQTATEPKGEDPLVQESTPGAAMPADEAPARGAAEAPATTAAGDLTFLPAQKEGHWLTSGLIGQEVTAPDGEALGEVAALEIGPDGKVVSVVIDAGGFLGLGAKRVAVPYDAVQHMSDTPDEQRLVVAVTSEQLEEAPDYVTLLQMRQEEEAIRAQQEMQATQPRTVDPANPPATE